MGKLVARPVVATKLFVPKRRHGVLTRPRLLDLLRGGAGSRLTLVSAPAGFGKTTLLADWLDGSPREERAVAWVSLDPSDTDPASFWTYVVTALQTAAPTIGSDVLELIASAPSPSKGVLTALVNELAATSGDLWLVLDDFHVVDNQEVRDGLTFLVEHLPPQVHVVLVTRADPDLPLPRWRARGELVEIRAADLRFTPDEAGTYLNGAAGLELAVQDVAVLAERTEGWIAALQLAVLSVQGRDDVHGFITRFAGNDRYIVDYLVEEVLTHQPEQVRSFLLHTAVLDRLTGPLCDVVTTGSGGSELLTTLERANLFVIPLDDRREWYRYHHLFADVLRARLLSEQPDLVPLLHQRASHWYEDHAQAEEAVQHALAARDVERAASLMEMAVPTMRRNRQDLTMVGWIDALPDDAVRRSPVLSALRGWMGMASGDLTGAEAWLDDAERALAAVPHGTVPPWPDTDELRALPATIAVYRASVAQARGDADATAKHARHALELAGPSDHLARGGAAGFLALAAWADGRVMDALETFAEAVASLHAAGSLVDALSGTVVLADLWLVAGRPSKARRLYERALLLAEPHGDTVARATAALDVGLSEIDCEVGDLRDARAHLDAAAVFVERGAMTESRYRWFVAMGRVAVAEGHPEQAISLLDQAEGLYQPGFFPDVRPIPAMRARVWIAHGQLAQALDWARERGVSAADPVSYQREFDHLTLVRLLVAQHRTHRQPDAVHQAVRLLDRLREAAQTAGRAGSLLEIGVLTALAADAQGHRTQALESLADAFAQAPEPEGYARLLLDEGAPMSALLRDAQRHGVAGDHVPRLLAILAGPGGDAAGPGQRTRAEAASTQLSERELQVLRLLGSELSGPQIAHELFVSHNTVRTHTKHIFTKLDVTSRRAAVLRAHERGLL
jgi:LuxR family transcriptional regulator, maltose regulon positive regulatory protein